MKESVTAIINGALLLGDTVGGLKSNPRLVTGSNASLNGFVQ